MQQDGSLTFDLEFLSDFKKWEDDYRAKNNADPSSELRKLTADLVRGNIRNSMYQQTLRELMDAGVPGIRQSESQQAQPVVDLNAPWWGELSVDPESEMHDFAVLRSQQYERGQKPVYWDEFQKNRPSKAKAAIDGFIINSSLTFEGLAGSFGEWVGSWTQYGSESQHAYADKYGIPRLKFNDIVRRAEGGTGIFGSAPLTAEERKVYDSYQAEAQEMIDLTRKAMGDQFRTAARTVVDAVTPNFVGLQQYRDVLVGSDPNAPQDIRERYGRAGGGALVTLGEMTGSAVGSIPYSLPAMATRNPRLAAALTSPFYGMGHTEAWSRRMAIYEEQLAESRAIGTEAPVRPSITELNRQAQVGGVIEFGSEFVGDRIQVGLPKLYNWSKAKIKGNVASASSAASAGAALRDSLSRRIGPLGVVKTGAIIGAGGVVEGLEEAVPELGKEFTDPFFIPEGYENDFWSAQTAEAVGSGFIAGTLIGGGQQAFGKDSRERRRAARRIREASETAVPRMAGAIVDKARRLEQERLQANSTGAQGPAAAIHQLEEMGAGRRLGMFVHPDLREDTLTEDVRERMRLLEIPEQPIGRYNGMDLYVMPAYAEQIAQMAADGDVSGVGGTPELMEAGLPMIGAFVIRNKGGQAVEVIPYSSSALAESAEPALKHRASLSGSTLENVDSNGLIDLSVGIGRQVEGEMEARKLAPRSKRPLGQEQRERGIGAMRLDVLRSAQGTKRNQPDDAAFSSPLLSQSELKGKYDEGPRNSDVEIDVEMTEVPEARLSTGEKAMVRASNGKAVILDAKVVYRITRPDGSVETIEKPTINDGGYNSQVSVDGLFLIRDGDTAYTMRNAVAIAMHELRHKLVGSSPAAAQHAAMLLYLDPAFAMRGGVEYMRRFESAMEAGGQRSDAEVLRLLDEAGTIKFYEGMHQAALNVLADREGYADAVRVLRSSTATDAQREAAQVRVEMQQTAESELATVERFAEESVAQTQTESIGQTVAQGIGWEVSYKDAQERSMRAFVGWFSSVLSRYGFAGVYGRQALSEIRQILGGYSEDALRIHERVRAEVEDKFTSDMRKYEEMKQSLVPPAEVQDAQTAEQPEDQAAEQREPQPGEPGYVGEMRPANIEVRPKSEPIPQQQSTVGTKPSKPVKPSGPYRDDTVYSMRPDQQGSDLAAIPGTDEDLDRVVSNLASVKTADPQDRMALVTEALGLLANLIPALTGTQATIGTPPVGGTGRPGMRYPGGVPGARAAGVAQARPAEAPQEMAPQEMAAQPSIEQARREGMSSLRGLTSQRVTELSGLGRFLDDRAFGPHQHPVDKSEDLDESAPLRVAQAADVPSKYLRDAASLDYLLGAIEHVAGAKTDTVEGYYDFIGKMRSAAETGLSTYDDMVVAAKRLGYTGIDGDLNLEQEDQVLSTDIDKIADMQFSLRPETRRKWEQESKAVDDGMLTTVYHGNSQADLERFDSVRMARTERPIGLGQVAGPEMVDGIWFTDRPSGAETAAGMRGALGMPNPGLVSRIVSDVNGRTLQAAAALPRDLQETFRANTGMLMEEYKVTPEGMLDAMSDGKTYEQAIDEHREYLQSQLNDDPRGTAILDQYLVAPELVTVARGITGNLGTVASANLYMANPLEVQYDPNQGEFLTEAEDAIGRMAAAGNDGLIMSMPDGERRYFVPRPSQVAILGRARDVNESARLLSLRRSVRGEYWIKPGGESLYADLDNGDMSHEMFAIAEAQSDFAAWLGDDAVNGIVEMAEDYSGYTNPREFSDDLAQELGIDEANDDWLRGVMDERGTPEAQRPSIQRMFEAAIGESVDAREYGLGKGWARVQGNNIQVRGLNDSILRDVADAMFEIVGEEDISNQEFTVEDLNSNRVFDGVPFAELDRGVRGLIPYRGDSTMRSQRDRGSFEPLLFSALERELDVADAKPMKAAAWKQRLKALVNSGKVKQAEIDWSGLSAFLESPRQYYYDKWFKEYVKDAEKAGKFQMPKTISTEDILDFLDKNAFRVKEVDENRWSSFTLSGGGLYNEVLLVTRKREQYPLYGPKMGTDLAEYGEGMRRREAVGEKFAPLIAEADAAADALNESASADREAMDALYRRQIEAATAARDYELENRLQLEWEEASNARLRRGKEIMERPAELRRQRQAEMDAAYEPPSGGRRVYRSSHFDEPNIIAHLRMKSRTDQNGKRVLFVEELQSDWGEQGRKLGFEQQPKTFTVADLSSPERTEAKYPFRTYYTFKVPGVEELVWAELPKDLIDFPTEAEELEWAQREALAKINDPEYQERVFSSRLPRGAFVETTDAWVTLALKELLLNAIEGGFDSVAFISGQQSAGVVARAMQKEVDSIKVYARDGGRYLLETFKNGEPVPTLERDSLTPDEMRELVGRELADNLMEGADQAKRENQDPDIVPGYTMSTDGMTLGDEGMKAFYGKVVPAAANKLLKKIGGDKIIDIPVEAGDGRLYRDSHLGFKITERMKQQYNEAGGYPMFSMRKQGPIETVKRQLEESAVEATSSLDDFFKSLWPKLLKGTKLQLKASPRNMREAARRAVSDISGFITENPKYLDYYETDWRTTRDLLSQHYGRGITDDEFLMFRVITGLTSPNTLLAQNMSDTVKLFDLWTSSGSFDAFELGPKPGTGNLVILKSPFTISGSTQNIKVRTAKIIERLIKEKGSVSKALEFLQEQIPVKELHQFNREMGYKGAVGSIGDVKRVVKNATGQIETIPRMFIFGPKVGAYTLNAIGDSRYTTVDIWESRFIRSYFRDLFAENTGLPVDSVEHELFTSFSEVFSDEFKKETGLDLPPSALQAARWFYILDAARRAGYTRALTNETISSYTERQLARQPRPEGTDPSGGPEGARANRTGIRAPAEGQVASDSKAEQEGLSGSMMSMRRGLTGVRDEGVLRYVDRYDELRRMVDEAADRGAPVPDVRNPYIGARLLNDRLADLQENAERRYARVLRDMAQDGVTLEEMDRFLMAQHARERNREVARINPAMPDGGSGMTNAEADAHIQAVRAAGRLAVMERHADSWRQFMREALVMRRDNGLITQDLYDTLTNTYQYYVPLRGAPARIGDEDFTDSGSGTGLSTAGRGMPRALGRRSEAEGVTSQVGHVFEDTLRRVERNTIGQSFLHLVQSVNDPLWAEVVRPLRGIVRPRRVGGRVVPGPGVVQYVHDPNWMSDPRNFGVFVNAPTTINGHDYAPGDLVVIRINNRRLQEGINKSAEALRSFERAIRYVNNGFRFLTTGPGNPTFAPVNAARDILTAVISNTAERGFRDSVGIVRNWAPSFYQVLMESWRGQPTGDYADFRRAGGDQRYWNPSDLEEKATQFDELYARAQRRDPNDRTLLRELFGWYPSLFTAAETATRLATFRQRIAAGDTEQAAALAARDITVDFAKGGTAKPILNTWYMYLNAGIQGNVNVLRTVSRAVSLAPTLFAMGFINAVMNRILGGDDEKRGQAHWDNLEPYQKSSAAHFFDPRGTGKAISIPLPYGYNTFFSAGVRVADSMFGRDSVSDAIGGVVIDALNAFNPMGGSGITQSQNVAAYFIPTIVRPAVEIPANEKWDGSPIWLRQYDKYQAPDSQAPFDGTPAAYTAFAQWMNQATGGDDYESGLIDMSPNTLQYLVGYYLSGAGRLVDRSYSLMTQPEPVSMSRVPGVRSFYANAAEASMGPEYYRMREEMAPAMRRTEAMMDETLPMAQRAAAGEGMTQFEATMAQWLEGYEEQLSQIRRAFKGATPDQRRAMVKLRAEIYDQAIRRRNLLTDQMQGR